jgi:exportin-T
VEIPDLEDADEAEVLAEAAEQADPQMYLFETAGVLIALSWKAPDEAGRLLRSAVEPLLAQLQAALQGPADVRAIVGAHHIIMALGNVARGFPDYPSPVPVGYTLPPLEVFQQMAQAILVSLEVMKVHRIVRDAVRSCGHSRDRITLMFRARHDLRSQGSWRRWGRVSRI